VPKHGGQWGSLAEIDAQSAVPLYQQLRERLRDIAGGLEEDTLLPSEQELMRRAGVSRATVRKAIADLVHEDLLTARQGKGTFVRARRVETPLDRPRGFTEVMRAAGRIPDTVLLTAELVIPAAPVMRALELRRGDRVVLLERVRRLEGMPCMLERAHLPSALVPGLVDLDLSGSLYELLAAQYGLAPASGNETLMAHGADARVAHLLGVPYAAPVLTTVRITRTRDGRPLELTYRDARGDQCAFRANLGAL
jgi:GntR family transcriptional regulator